jgi:quercetin dioxygenase-like cupin family protein
MLAQDELERFVEDLAADPSIWARHVRYAPFERTCEMIHDGEDVNAWLICWSEDADTGFHDHDESAAAIRVIEGAVREDRLCLGPPPRERVVAAGETFTVPPTAIHRVLHAAGEPAVTIHAYSPPLTRMGSYWVGPGGELQRIAQSGDHELTELKGALT